MKIEIFGESKEPEKTLRLKLRRCLNSVAVVAVDEVGSQLPGGNLITFKEDGTIYLHACISDDIGLKLNEVGALVVSGS